MKKKDLSILKVLLSDTLKGDIYWVKSLRKEYTGWISSFEYWKGEKKITDNKKIVFIFKYNIHDHANCDMQVFLYDAKYNKRELIYVVEPGILSFRTMNNVRKLIKLLEKIALEQANLNKQINDFIKILGEDKPKKEFEIGDEVKLFGTVDGKTVNGIRGKIIEMTKDRKINSATGTFKVENYQDICYKIESLGGNFWWVSKYNMIKIAKFEEVVY